jgi:hypothetical protein
VLALLEHRNVEIEPADPLLQQCSIDHLIVDGPTSARLSPAHPEALADHVLEG